METYSQAQDRGMEHSSIANPVSPLALDSQAAEKELRPLPTQLPGHRGLGWDHV